jgi:methionyl-tRNA formyltransferase
MSPRVVLLTKRYPLAAALEHKIATTGCLVGVVHEDKPSGLRSNLTDVRRLAARVGVVRALDVVAYQIYQRAFRRADLRRQYAALDTRPAAGIPRSGFASLNSEPARVAIRALEPELLIVHGTGILKPATFELAPLAVNLHCGILPEYRGHDSTFWALHAGDYERVGCSLHVIDAGVDTGTLIAEARVPCGPGDSDLDAWFAAFAAGIDLAVALVETLRRGVPVTYRPAAGKPGKHYGRKGLTDYLTFALRRRHAASRVLRAAS